MKKLHLIITFGGVLTLYLVVSVSNKVTLNNSKSDCVNNPPSNVPSDLLIVLTMLFSVLLGVYAGVYMKRKCKEAATAPVEVVSEDETLNL